MIAQYAAEGRLLVLVLVLPLLQVRQLAHR